MMLLSILIPTIPEREEQFNRLKTELDKQLNAFTELHWEFLRDFGGIEILSDNSKRYLEGGLTIGAKRNKLLKMATGKYVAFADDDDNIAPNYLETIARMCSQDADAISFRCLFKCDTYWTVIDMSLEHETDEGASPHKIVKRKIWHVCPIKRSIAEKFSFSELNHNEEAEWLNRIIPELKTEIHTDQILTQYNHSSKGSEADKIIKQGHK